MDAVAVDREGQRGEESFGCGEDIGCGHLRESRPADCTPKWPRHVKPMHMVVQHLHWRLGVDSEAGPIDVHEVDGCCSVGIGQQVALHGQRDVSWCVADGACGVDAWGGRCAGGCDPMHQRKHHVPSLLQPLQGLQVTAVEQRSL